MNTIKIEPATLQGQIRIPPSKSISHRAVICAGLAAGTSRIENLIFSEDITATLNGMSMLGTKVVRAETAAEGEPSAVEIAGTPDLLLSGDIIDCQESGSTLRFLIPLAMKTGRKVSFTGRGKLVERPLDVYYQMFEEQGLTYHTIGGFLPLTVEGSLQAGIYQVKGNVSSQFITGLMFLLPLLTADSKIVITTDLESKGYVDLTMDVQKKFGIEIENKDYREFAVKGGQKYQSCRYRVEGDYSQAAFWLVAGALGGKTDLLDLNPASLQGDRVILDIAQGMGVDFQKHSNGVLVLPASTRGTVIDAGQCPDLVPVLTVLAALSKGTTRIINAARLRIKESDRLKTISSELNKLGANVQELDEGLLIEGVESLHGGTVDSWNDHRIAMALAVASIRSTGPVILTGADAVKKSYPHFWSDFAKLGGKIQ